MEKFGCTNNRKRDFIIEKVIIKERRTVEVWCHISLPQLVTASTVNMGYEPIGRDSWNKNKQFEANILPFELKFRLPKLRKWRIISQRDELGRIVHLRPSQLVLDDLHLFVVFCGCSYIKYLKMPRKEDEPITYASTGVNYDAMDSLKRLTQLRARATAGNLERFGMREVEASCGESAYAANFLVCN